MNRLNSAVLIICLVAKLQPLYGYKWIASKAGDPIPRNAVLAYASAYVGRARHVNLVLPAEVTYEGANIYYLTNKIKKNEYEVLVADEECTWVDSTKVTEQIVRGGSAWNEEPTFIGKLPTNRIEPVQLTSDRFWAKFNLLSCENNIKWVDYSSGTIPNNAVGGGKTKNHNDAFVARLLGPWFFVAGHITAEYNNSGMTTATYAGFKISSMYSQVLVGDTNEYSWKSVRNGKIPTNAVAAGVSGKGLIYVSREYNRTLGSITFEEVFNNRRGYEVDILVKNIE